MKAPQDPSLREPEGEAGRAAKVAGTAVAKVEAEVATLEGPAAGAVPAGILYL
jgi:hypothetical protein